MRAWADREEPAVVRERDPRAGRALDRPGRSERHPHRRQWPEPDLHRCQVARPCQDFIKGFEVSTHRAVSLRYRQILAHLAKIWVLQSCSFLIRHPKQMDRSYLCGEEPYYLRFVSLDNFPHLSKSVECKNFHRKLINYSTQWLVIRIKKCK